MDGSDDCSSLDGGDGRSSPDSNANTISSSDLSSRRGAGASSSRGGARDDGVSNPFLASLPSKPDALVKTRDLQGAINVPEKIKNDEWKKKLVAANKRIEHGEKLVKSLHYRASETHRIASSALTEGGKLLNAARRDLKAATTALEKSKEAGGKTKNELELLKVSFRVLLSFRLSSYSHVSFPARAIRSSSIRRTSSTSSRTTSSPKRSGSSRRSRKTWPSRRRRPRTPRRSWRRSRARTTSPPSRSSSTARRSS